MSMREEFEKWYREARRSAYDEPDLGIDKQRQYSDTHAHEAYVVWQASRAALEVELPPQQSYGPHPDDWGLPPVETRAAIEGAGVRVKP